MNNAAEMELQFHDEFGIMETHEIEYREEFRAKWSAARTVEILLEMDDTSSKTWEYWELDEIRNSRM